MLNTELNRDQMYDAISAYIDMMTSDGFTDEPIPDVNNIFVKGLIMIKHYKLKYPNYYKTSFLFEKLEIKMGTEPVYMN